MRHAAFVCLVLCCCASAVSAKPGAVRTKDGRTIEGEITENVDTVTIALKAASITLARGDVDSIVYAANVEDMYKQRLVALPAGAGARSHLELARWLYDNKAYELARKEAMTALELEPNNADAFFLRQTIDRSMLWDKKTGAAGAATQAAASAMPPATRAAASRRPVLSTEQINLIRQHEVKESERLRVRFDNNVIRRYGEADKRDMRQFASSPDMVKAFAIMKNPELKKDVHILSDPAAMAEYRAHIQPFIISGCASAACHGGGNAGTFALVTPADSEAVTYTNFYILSRYAVNVDGAAKKLVDRQQPESSLLLQFAMARDAAKRPHPDVPNFAAIFRNRSDPRPAKLAQWIGMLSVPEPDYGIDFAVPGMASAPPPAAAAAAPATKAPDAGNARKPAAPNTRPAAVQDKPPANERPNNGSDANDTLKELRGRLRPIRGL